MNWIDERIAAHQINSSKQAKWLSLFPPRIVGAHNFNRSPSGQNITSWWLNQPIWKICSSNWIISLGRGEHKKNWKHDLVSYFTNLDFPEIAGVPFPSYSLPFGVSLLFKNRGGTCFVSAWQLEIGMRMQTCEFPRQVRKNYVTDPGASKYSGPAGPL